MGSPSLASADARRRVLVVEDERMVAEVVERYLRRDGHDVRTVGDGLVVLDVMLPGIDGFEVCRRLRARSAVAVVMLTARGEEVDKLVGLGIGADDYITKPFSPRELAARVAAVLRRTGTREEADGEALRFPDLRINARTRSVENAGGRVELTAREFDLLYHLARHPGRVFTREQLMTDVWDYAYAGAVAAIAFAVGMALLI